MSRVSWHLFQNRQEQAYLVVAFISQAEGLPGGSELSGVHGVLKRLLSKQKPAGAYALTVVRDAGRPEVHLAFEAESDARKFAAAERAQAIGNHPGWASQWELQLDGEKVAAIEASLPPQKKRLERAPLDQSPLGRGVKRGPRGPARYDD